MLRFILGVLAGNAVALCLICVFNYVATWRKWGLRAFWEDCKYLLIGIAAYTLLVAFVNGLYFFGVI